MSSAFHPQGATSARPPVAAQGYLCFTNDDGEVFIVRAGPRYEAAGQNSMGEITLATPAIAGNALYVRTRSHLYAIAESAKRSSQ